jgi:hypothetical protein
MIQRKIIISLSSVKQLIVAMETHCFYIDVASLFVFISFVVGQVNSHGLTHLQLQGFFLLLIGAFFTTPSFFPTIPLPRAICR